MPTAEFMKIEVNMKIATNLWDRLLSSPCGAMVGSAFPRYVAGLKDVQAQAAERLAVSVRGHGACYMDLAGTSAVIAFLFSSGTGSKRLLLGGCPDVYGCRKTQLKN